MLAYGEVEHETQQLDLERSSDNLIIMVLSGHQKKGFIVITRFRRNKQASLQKGIW